MANPVWGQLQKALDDSETIEQAIARLIQAHDDDANAHLDTGQSLQSHKASEIIDHLIKSIVPDKLEIGFFSNYGVVGGWQSLDACWTGGDAVNLNFNYINIQGNLYYLGYSYLKIKAGVQYADNPFVEFDLSVSSSGVLPREYLGYFGMGDGYESEDEPFVGFKVEDGVLYGEININIGETVHTIEIAGIDPALRHSYRVEYYYGIGAKFYVDDELAATLNYTDVDELSGIAFTARIEGKVQAKLASANVYPPVYGLIE